MYATRDIFQEDIIYVLTAALEEKSSSIHLHYKKRVLTDILSLVDKSAACVSKCIHFTSAADSNRYLFLVQFKSLCPYVK